MKLSVIIPCYNGAATIGVQLEALAKQTWCEPWEVIVADNGSTDDSRKIIEQYRDKVPNLRVVDASDRRGQPHALNTGAAAAMGDALAFCDADDEVGPGWVRAMGEALLQHDFVACRIDFTKLNPPWLQTVFRGHAQQHGGLPKGKFPPYLWHAGGGTLGVRKSLHAAVGGFSDDLPYLHDTDYCFKIQLRGAEMHFLPEAVVHIRCRRTLGGLLRQARHWAEYSMLLYKMYRPRDGQDSWGHWKDFFDEWKGILLSTPQTLSGRTSRARWVWRLGWQLGRFVGSIKHHVPPV
jgi:glycosyltransferase involved in cell wall biosynthesis